MCARARVDLCVRGCTVGTAEALVALTSGASLRAAPSRSAHVPSDAAAASASLLAATAAAKSSLPAASRAAAASAPVPAPVCAHARVSARMLARVRVCTCACPCPCGCVRRRVCGHALTSSADARAQRVKRGIDLGESRHHRARGGVCRRCRSRCRRWLPEHARRPRARRPAARAGRHRHAAKRHAAARGPRWRPPRRAAAAHSAVAHMHAHARTCTPPLLPPSPRPHPFPQRARSRAPRAGVFIIPARLRCPLKSVDSK